MQRESIASIMETHHRGWRAVSGETLNEDDFFTRLYEVITPNTEIVSTRQAGDIEELMSQWESSPTKRKSPYNSNTVRQQARSGKLKKISPEEQAIILGVVIPQTSFYRLEDVLRLQLGRWPYEKRAKKETKKLGRPKKETKEKTERKDREAVSSY